MDLADVPRSHDLVDCEDRIISADVEHVDRKAHEVGVDLLQGRMSMPSPSASAAWPISPMRRGKVAVGQATLGDEHDPACYVFDLKGCHGVGCSLSGTRHGFH